MSRGPGRIERAIKELFAANPDLAFGVVDLVEHCYPSAHWPEKKHTVSVIRAAHKVVDKDPDWAIWQSNGQGGALVFVNEASLQSYCLAWLMVDNIIYYRSPKRALRCGCLGLAEDRASLLAKLAPGGRHHDLFEKSKNFVDLHIAERDGDPRAAKIKAQIEAEETLSMLTFRALCRG